MKTISVTVNGKAHTADVEPRTSIADFLRETLLLTGTHLGCEHGVCGACTVNINGRPARSCITFAVACDGDDICTIEGFDDDPLMADLRKSFTAEHGLQCGYCTPGMLITAHDIVRRLPEADEARVRLELSGNLCRCTGYVGIVNAICSVIDSRPAYAEKSRTTPVSAQTNAPPATVRKAARAAPSGQMTAMDQSFTIQHHRDDVWNMFKDLSRVVSCIPGASLTEPPNEGHVKGKITIKLGMIRTNFSGEADIELDQETYTGILHGSGLDSGHSSRAYGEVTYSLVDTEDGAATLVDIVVAFSLSGTLAQFSRGGIIKAVADRMTQTFAANLEIWERLKSIFSFLFRKS
jgi:carbon-monoxide dehydrogenase small subunit